MRVCASHSQAFALPQVVRIPAVRHGCTFFLRCYTSADWILETCRAVELRMELRCGGRHAMNDEAPGSGGLGSTDQRARSSHSPWGRAPKDDTRRFAVDAERGRATYAALDLGTNNCRLLVARPTGNGFRVVDAFSRIIRL